MGFRHWLQERLGGASPDDGGDRSLLDSFWERDEKRIHALGEYDANSYPRELAELLSRRQQVADQLLEIDVGDREARVEAIPRLREMLRLYPHPLVYELLIHAYIDAGRADEARGVGFAARERRIECMRSEHPEVRWEVEHLREWTPEDIEELRQKRGPVEAAPAAGPPGATGSNPPPA